MKTFRIYLSISRYTKLKGYRICIIAGLNRWKAYQQIDLSGLVKTISGEGWIERIVTFLPNPVFKSQLLPLANRMAKKHHLTYKCYNLCVPYTVWLDIPTRILQNVLYSITLGSQILSPSEPAFWLSSFPLYITGYVVWHVRQWLTILFTASSNTTSRNVRNTEHTLIKNSMLIFSVYEFFCFELWLINS